MTRPGSAPNGPENTALSPRQEAVAISVAAGMTLAAASRKAGVGERTVKTWSGTCPAFRRRVMELRSEMTTQALGRLVDGMTSAADTLGYLARNARSETVRLGAARAVLELATKLRESIELEERIARLETEGVHDG